MTLVARWDSAGDNNEGIPQLPGQITAIAINGEYGVMDNINNTITFHIPYFGYTGRVYGNITTLVADESTIIFMSAGAFLNSILIIVGSLKTQ